MVARSQPNEIHITRVYDAPVEMVWDAWTDPEQVAQWWGPRGFSLTTHSKELRPGGIWHYTMHGPDGVDYPNMTLYHEVEEFRKLVYDHGAYVDRPPMFRVTVEFAESKGKTTMEMTMTLPTAEEAAAARKFIKAAGGNATWDRLAEFLDAKTNGRHSFVINRSFAASPELLFEMWTDPQHLCRWLPPPGFTMEVLSGEIRTGCECLFRMSDGADMTLHGRFQYQELNAPARLVYIQQFCDSAGNISRHPGLPVFPPSLEVTVLFAAEDEQNTRVTVTTVPLGTVTDEEVKAFLDTLGSMTQGWSASFDQLDDVISG
ncbi:SRPBCC domain-containing protein [Planctomicrobium sp. SH661]|uniref:SRPBCC domain-containing protein n=1 Tax=Planctomicrobium sp. SH661 TaxID=3448124 RepID=UPI003F5B448B